MPNQYTSSAGGGARLGRLAAAVTGPRGRWVAIVAWIALGVGGYLAHERIDGVIATGQSTFLPADAESSRAVEALRLTAPGDAGGGSGAGSGGGSGGSAAERSAGGESGAGGSAGGEWVPAVIVFERRGGLSEADLAAIGRIGEGIDRLGLTGATPALDPFDGEDGDALGGVARVANGIGPLSEDGEAALVVLALDAGDRGAVVGGVEKIRRYLREHERPGLRAYVTGPAGIAADLERVAEEAGRTLLIATLSLVLVLLLAVYRAPPLALLPLIAVGAAYLVATAVAYLLIESGLITVNTEGTFLLLVLVFGAGTDYSLLLVHRYREELGRGAEPRGALPAAVAASGPAIAASGGTVIAAMLVLLVADLESTRWLGPVLAIGIAVMLAAAFTLLPALLSVLGRRAFWPSSPSRGSLRTASVEKEPRDVWGRVAGGVRRRSRAIVVAVLALLAVLALGNLIHHDTLGFGQGETRPTNSGHGTRVLEEHFPPGLGSPLAAVVEAERLPAVTRGLRQLNAVRLALPVPAANLEGDAVVALVLAGDPYASSAGAQIEAIRDRLHAIDPGGLLGGFPAENYDIEQANDRDTRLILPLILLVVGLILVAVLRALLAPAYLIATVVASFAATLGLATFLFTELLGMEGIGFNLVLMSFLFLVALGVDYNIFLMARARQEAEAVGTREGVLRALVNTGGVVTGAGLILAGTFATLTLLPLEELAQIGATVALGVLLDTFVVRALLIPAITYRLGDRAWWPSRLSGRG